MYNSSQLKTQEPVYEINLQIWDTVGQEAYRSINRLYYKGCAGCILVYDLAKPNSLDSLESWLEEFLNNFQESSSRDDPTDISFIVLGNKLDRVQTGESENKREGADSFRKPERTDK